MASSQCPPSRASLRSSSSLHLTLLPPLLLLLLLLLPFRADGQACFSEDPARPGNVYDLTPLTNLTRDYTVPYELVALYTFQFCRALVQPINPATCPITGANSSDNEGNGKGPERCNFSEVRKPRLSALCRSTAAESRAFLSSSPFS